MLIQLSVAHACANIGKKRRWKKKNKLFFNLLVELVRIRKILAYIFGKFIAFSAGSVQNLASNGKGYGGRKLHGGAQWLRGNIK